MWIMVLEVAGVIGGIATVFALLLAPMFWVGSKVDQVKSELAQFRAEVAVESKEFHGRLCVLDERTKK